MEYVNLEGDLVRNPEISVSGDPTVIGIAVGLTESPVTLITRQSTSRTQQLAQVLSELADEQSTRESEVPTSAMIGPLDPWLVVVANLMMEAIVQGVTWDTAHFAINRVISYMQSRGIAPESSSQKESNTTVRFRWSGYLESIWLKKLFMRMEVHYKQNTKSTLKPPTSPAAISKTKSAKVKANNKKAKKKPRKRR